MWDDYWDETRCHRKPSPLSSAFSPKRRGSSWQFVEEETSGRQFSSGWEKTCLTDRLQWPWKCIAVYTFTSLHSVSVNHSTAQQAPLFVCLWLLYIWLWWGNEPDLQVIKEITFYYQRRHQNQMGTVSPCAVAASLLFTSEQGSTGSFFGTCTPPPSLSYSHSWAETKEEQIFTCYSRVLKSLLWMQRVFLSFWLLFHEQKV